MTIDQEKLDYHSLGVYAFIKSLVKDEKATVRILAQVLDRFTSRISEVTFSNDVSISIYLRIIARNVICNNYYIPENES